MIRCVKLSAPPRFSFCFVCFLFAFWHILASLISRPFVVPFVPEAVQRCKYQRGHNGKMRNAGCMLGKWKKNVCILCASCGYDLKITGKRPESFWKKSQIECNRVKIPKKVKPFWHIFILFVLGLEGSLQSPGLGSLTKNPVQNPCFLQNPNQGSFKCTLKTIPFKTSAKSKTWVRLLPQIIPLQNAKFPGHVHIALKKLYYEMVLYNPRRLGFCRGNSWGYPGCPKLLQQTC